MYPWGARHPWQSWQNRYKKRKKYFDDAINDYLDIHPSLKENWSIEEAHNKRAARRLGIRPKETDVAESDHDDQHLDVRGEAVDGQQASRHASPPRKEPTQDLEEAEGSSESEETDPQEVPQPTDAEEDDEAEVLAHLASSLPSLSPPIDSPLPTRPTSRTAARRDPSSSPPPWVHSSSSSAPKPAPKKRQRAKTGDTKQAKVTRSRKAATAVKAGAASRVTDDSDINHFEDVRDAPPDAPVPRWASGSGAYHYGYFTAATVFDLQTDRRLF